MSMSEATGRAGGAGDRGDGRAGAGGDTGLPGGRRARGGTYVTEAEAARVRESLGDAGGRLKLERADVTDGDAVAGLVGRTVAQWGSVDFLLNLVGGFAGGQPLWETDDALWTRMIDLNLRSAVVCCRAVLPGMIERNYGRVVNVSSRTARAPAAGRGPLRRDQSRRARPDRSPGRGRATLRRQRQLRPPQRHRHPGQPARPPRRRRPRRWVRPDQLARIMVWLTSPAPTRSTARLSPSTPGPERPRRAPLAARVDRVQRY